MLRSIVVILIAAFLSFNLLGATLSPSALCQTKTIAPHWQIPDGDSLDVSEFAKLSRKEFENLIGKKLTTDERKEFRRMKRAAWHNLHMSADNKSDRKGLWWKLSIFVGGCAALALGFVTNLGCEEDGCSKKWADVIALTGAGLAIAGFFILLNHGNKPKEKKKDNN